MKTHSLALLLLASSAPALAQEPPPPPPPAQPAPAPEPVVVVEAAPAPPPFAIGLKVGVLLPQLATELGTTVSGGIEASFALPFAQRRVAIYLEANYTQPQVSRSAVSDPRFAGGSYDDTTTQRELTLGGGLLARIFPPGALWNGYLLAGARAYLLETTTDGSAAGNAFGENTEKSTQVGGFVAAGAERRLGPGAALLEVGYGASSLPHTITGDVSTGALVIQLGYRLFF